MAAVASCLIPRACEAVVYLDMYSPTATKLPLVVPPFKKDGTGQAGDAVASKMQIAIAEDLEFSGCFKLLDTSAVNDPVARGVDMDTIDWDAVSILGAFGIVTGLYSSEAGGMACELRYFDAVQHIQVLGKKYVFKPEEHRDIAHRFCNELFQALFKENGIFNTRIAYVTQTAGGNKEIFASDYDGYNASQLTRYNSLTLNPSWSPDGMQISFTSYKDGNPNVYAMDTVRGASRGISKKKGVNITPAWSPDGSKIALTLNQTADNSEIYLLTETTRALERMTFDPSLDVSPSWSPDGARMAFVTDRTGSPQIFVLEVASKRVKRVTLEGSYNTAPAWSPRGDIIAYSGMSEGKHNIYLTTSEGQVYKQLTSGSGNNEHPAWSPDGRCLAFSSDRTGHKEIYIMRADGTGQRRITFGTEDKAEPAWSPWMHKQ